MKFIKRSGGSAKIIYLFIITGCFYFNTARAVQGQELFQNMEGYYVGMKDDTSYVTLKIMMYLEEPDYVVLQYGINYSDETGNIKKLTFKNTKSYGFAFDNRLIRMVAIKNGPFTFLRLMDNGEYKLPDGDFKLFIKYTFPNGMIASLLKEPLTKQYFYQVGDSKRLYPMNNMLGINKLGNRLSEQKE